MGLTNTPSDLLPGTLELLILKSLVSGPKHGYAIVEHLRVTSQRRAARRRERAVSGPPAAAGEWLGKSGMGRLRDQSASPVLPIDAAGRKQLAGERAEFERMVRAIQHVLEAM